MPGSYHYAVQQLHYAVKHLVMTDARLWERFVMARNEIGLAPSDDLPLEIKVSLDDLRAKVTDADSNTPIEKLKVLCDQLLVICYALERHSGSKK